MSVYTYKNNGTFKMLKEKIAQIWVQYSAKSSFKLKLNKDNR